MNFEYPCFFITSITRVQTITKANEAYIVNDVILFVGFFWNSIITTIIAMPVNIISL